MACNTWRTWYGFAFPRSQTLQRSLKRIPLGLRFMRARISLVAVIEYGINIDTAVKACNRRSRVRRVRGDYFLLPTHVRVRARGMLIMVLREPALRAHKKAAFS